MYEAYFGLKDTPFAITPDPGYLYLSPPHQEALAHLLYGTGDAGGGFVQLTGEVGTGKTTLVRALVEHHLADVDLALCLNPRLTAVELVATLCDELHIPYPLDATLKTLTDVLNRHLLASHAAGRRTVVVIDEAQNLAPEVLEQVRLLTNLETHRHKLLRIILVGQPELQALLARSDMRQLAQRITARCHLVPLNRPQTVAYIQHRLRVAGGRADLFTPAAQAAAYRLTQGIPRLINIICDRALLGAYSRGRPRVDTALFKQAAREVALPLPRRASVPLTAVGKQRLVGTATLLATALMMVFIGPSLSDYLPEGVHLEAMMRWPSPQTLASNKAPPTPPTALVQTPSSAPSASPVTPPLPALIPITDPGTVSEHLQTEAAALTHLLALWGESNGLDEGAAACDQVRRFELRCLRDKGDWHSLQQHNRPSVLTIRYQDTRGQITLRSVEGDVAVLDGAHGSVSIALNRLASVWTGEYVLLWRPPTAARLIGPGAQGEPVIWVRRQLARASGEEPPPTLSDAFDSALREQVRAFQRAHGLTADGLVGQQTMAFLHNVAPEPGTPVLQRSAQSVL